MDMIGKVRRMKMRDGLTHSEIARRTGLSRNTVKKWLKADSVLEPKYRRAGKSTLLTPFEGVVVSALKADAHRPREHRRTARALLVQLQAQGYRGGYTTLTNFIRDWKGQAGKDFAPVALLGAIPLVMVTPPQNTAKTVNDLVVMAKAKPGQLSYASYGAGSAGHIASEMILSMAGADMVHVPYRGSGPALVDVMGNQVSMMLATVTAAVGVAKEGKVKPLAVTSAKRVGAFPQVPTVAESGFPNYELVEWEAIQAPANTPKDVIDTLNKALREVVAMPDVRAKMATLGIEPDATSSPAEVSAFIQKERDKFSKIIQERGIKPQ